MTNIKNNIYKKIDCRLIDDNYLDFMLSKCEINEPSEEKETIKLEFNKSDGKHIVSDVSWSGAIASDTILENIGFTGVDNGFISYKKDRISNEEFLNLYTKSKFDLSTYNDKFFVTEVNGNTGIMNYPIEKTDEYVSLKGGFYQGFFKIEGDDYQTLPHQLQDEWNFSITLRSKDYKISSNTLNYRHTNNNGIFFYIGTRAENKFWELYKKEESNEDYKQENSKDYSLDYDYVNSNVTRHQYLEDIPDFNYECENVNCSNNGLAIDDEYFMKDISLEGMELKDTKGYEIGEKGFYEIETDNKFITFNNTKDGFNYKTWDDNNKIILTGKKDSPNINYFTHLNNAKNGFDKNNIHNLDEENSYPYKLIKDIENNALALKLNSNGSISYRYLTNKGELIEETSKENIVPNDEWVTITLKIIRKTYTNDCNNTPGKMQLYIYVNGFLKLVSKELDIINLHSLNDNSTRQEGVPYTISIGGGTQGLCERIMLDYYDMPDYILPIEKYFAGTFIGDIKSFSFIPGVINLKTIKSISFS